jgi:hypothetical protein
MAAAKGAAGRMTLVSTRNPEIVMKAFNDPAYPWWLHGQVLLLSAKDGAPPDMERGQLLALSDEDWTTAAHRLAPLGISGVLRPGVDGDVAGLFCLTEGFYEVGLAALEREARAASFGWSIVTEDDFALLAGA